MKKHYKIWGEHISLVHLLISTIISITFIFIAIFIERKIFINSKNRYELLFGLIGVTIALIINIILFKPKRNIIWHDGEKNDD